MKLATSIVFAILSLWGCNKGSDVNTNTKLLSTSLAAATGSRATLTTSGCGTGFSACITPTSVTGKAYYAGMIVGESNGLSLGPLLGEVEDPSDASAFKTTELLDFDFSEGLTNAGQPSLGGPIPYPADAEAIVQNAHIYFGWMDVTFELDATVPVAIRGTHTVRIVMADISDAAFKKGDVLYKDSDDTDFQWCTSSSGCTHTTRPESPLQISTIASYSNTENEGNPTIPSFFANLETGHEDIQVKESDLKTKTLTFTWDFDMSNGVKFTSNPTGINSVYDLVAATRLPAEPRDEDAGFTVEITVSE